MNRAALYEQAIAAGKSHLEASYAARDTMDFTNTGAWPAVQFLIYQAELLPDADGAIRPMPKADTA